MRKTLVCLISCLSSLALTLAQDENSPDTAPAEELPANDTTPGEEGAETEEASPEEEELAALKKVVYASYECMSMEVCTETLAQGHLRVHFHVAVKAAQRLRVQFLDELVLLECARVAGRFAEAAAESHGLVCVLLRPGSEDRAGIHVQLTARVQGFLDQRRMGLEHLAPGEDHDGECEDGVHPWQEKSGAPLG